MLKLYFKATPVSTRTVYSGVGEVSVYISIDCKGKGIASKLFKILIEESENAGFWTLQSSIFTITINTSSIQLHKKMGFRFLVREKELCDFKYIFAELARCVRRIASTSSKM